MINKLPKSVTFEDFKMRDCLPLLVAVCTLQSFTGRLRMVAGDKTTPGTFQLPSRTPGMTDDEYAQAVNNALSSIPGARFSFTGSTRRPVSGKVGNPPNYASGRSQVGNDNLNNGNRQWGSPGTNYNLRPNTPPGPDSPSTPAIAPEGSSGYNPVSSLTANQFGQRNGGVQDGVGGVQQQVTSSQTTPVFDPKGGDDAAEKVAFAIVDGLRNVWKTQHKLTGREKNMMDVCEQAVANQQPAMKEMKKSDKTLLDVLPLWREKLIVELEKFYQKEVRATEIYRGSQHLNSLLLVFAECVRPKLVLMKV